MVVGDRLYLISIGSAEKRENTYIKGGGCAFTHQKTAFSVLFALGTWGNFRNIMDRGGGSGVLYWCFGGLWLWLSEANYLPNKTAKIICLINCLTLLACITAIHSLPYVFLWHLQGVCLPYLPIYCLLCFEGLKRHVLRGC